MEITGKRGPEGVVKAVCTSEKKGVEKHSVPEGHFLKDFGIEGDAHAGKWHRQVSLLSYDKVKEFNERGAQVEDGAFGENLVVEGIDFRSLPVGMMIYIGDVVLRMTQIGKECHSHCAIYKRMGECNSGSIPVCHCHGCFRSLVSHGKTGSAACKHQIQLSAVCQTH